jgi:hypothetical protein
VQIQNHQAKEEFEKAAWVKLVELDIHLKKGAAFGLYRTTVTGIRFTAGKGIVDFPFCFSRRKALHP